MRVLQLHCDSIEYTPIKEMFVSRALSPANVKSVKIQKDGAENGKDKAIVTISEDQKSKAIGKSGINIRLASMLTGMQIELVESDSVTNEDGEIEEPKDGVDALEALFN